MKPFSPKPPSWLQELIRCKEQSIPVRIFCRTVPELIDIIFYDLYPSDSNTRIASFSNIHFLKIFCCDNNLTILKELS